MHGANHGMRGRWEAGGEDGGRRLWAHMHAGAGVRELGKGGIAANDVDAMNGAATTAAWLAPWKGTRAEHHARTWANRAGRASSAYEAKTTPRVVGMGEC